MTKAPRICPCNNVVPYGELCACQQKARQQRNQRHDTHRPAARDRGYNHEWRKARAEYLAMHPHCRECAKSGITRLATVVDHIIPHCGDKNLFWHRANWQPLCKPCHDSVKQRQERSAGFANCGRYPEKAVNREKSTQRDTKNGPNDRSPFVVVRQLPSSQNGEEEKNGAD